jgi:hypothetical protein
MLSVTDQRQSGALPLKVAVLGHIQAVHDLVHDASDGHRHLLFRAQRGGVAVIAD